MLILAYYFLCCSLASQEHRTVFHHSSLSTQDPSCSHIEKVSAWCYYNKPLILTTLNAHPLVDWLYLLFAQSTSHRVGRLIHQVLMYVVFSAWIDRCLYALMKKGTSDLYRWLLVGHSNLCARRNRRLHHLQSSAGQNISNLSIFSWSQTARVATAKAFTNIAFGGSLEPTTLRIAFCRTKEIGSASSMTCI